MQIEIFSLCDAATMYGSHLNILGSFECIQAPGFPAQHHQCAIAIKVRFEETDHRDHQIETRIIDTDGQPLLPSVQHAIGRPPNVTGSHVHVHIWHINGLTFPAPGEYCIDLLLDRDLRARIPLMVSQA